MTYKDREVPDYVQDFRPDDEIKPLRGFPHYFITENAEIISIYGSSPSVMSTEDTTVNETAYTTVHLTKNGKKHHRSVDSLMDDHFGSKVYGQSAYEIYDYLTYCYEDKTALQWAEDVVKDKISHHDDDAKTKRKHK